MVSQSLVLGFHGCDLAVAERVFAGKDVLRPSKNEWDWLGHGIYFWEDSPSRAMKWAKWAQQKKLESITQPAVVGAVIDLGNCLNLADAEALQQVKAAHQVYADACKARGSPLAKNLGNDLGSRQLDCAVIEVLHQLRSEKGLPAFETVRGFFFEGQQLYPNAGFRELDHIQICIRSEQQILGYFRPR